MTKQTVKQKDETRFLFTAVSCVLLVFLLVAVVIPSLKLNRARKLLASGDYASAYALVRDMDYKDSAGIAAQCLFPLQKAGLGDATVGATLRFGVYEQDNDPSNGPEEIEWLVLDVDGTKALVVSKYGLEAREFNDELNVYHVVTWANSQLRTWLNDTFYRTAFSAEHQQLILTTEVAAGRSPVSDVHPGRDTKDHIFLLSIDEATRYFDSDSARQCRATESCSTKKMEKDDDGFCYWWLRSPGIQDSCPVVVIARGSIFTNGFSCGHKPEIAVRPAMWIELGGN